MSEKFSGPPYAGDFQNRDMLRPTASSPYLSRPLRSKGEMAIDVAIRALVIIAKPVEGESELERAMRLTAQTALDRIEILTA